MNESACFVPGAECSRLHIVSDALFGAPEKSQLPIVNRARAISCEVRDPTLFNEPINDLHRPVFDQMRAIHQDHAGIPLAGRRDSSGAISNGPKRFRSTTARGRCRLDQNLLDATEAFALRQGPDLEM